VNRNRGHAQRGELPCLRTPRTDLSFFVAAVCARFAGRLLFLLNGRGMRASVVSAGGTGAMQRSREAARGAGPWREAVNAISGLATRFNSTIHKPLACSQWK